MNLHTVALLAQAAAVPFTLDEAYRAELSLMGRYTRATLKALLQARRAMRRNLRASIQAGHLTQANEQATLMHSFGVRAVLCIRRHARAVRG